jgi:SAM-dependent methyltransferase
MVDRSRQKAYFERGDRAHLRWQIGPGYFAETERRLVAAAGLPPGRLLEIGCGEGANLAHLGAPSGAVGVDFSRRKLSLARDEVPGPSWARCDAAALPFASAAFDAVLVRDLLHHVEDRCAVVAEAARVLRPGGALAVIEPNRRSPFILAQAALVSAERGALASDDWRLVRELREAGLVDVALAHEQPLPLARVLTHPNLGLAAVGRSRLARRLFDGVSAAALRLVPRRAWMYLVARARKPGAC